MAEGLVTQRMSLQIFSRATSEFEGTGLVSFQVSVTDGYQTDLERGVRSNIERFRPVKSFLQPWILPSSVTMTSTSSLLLIVKKDGGIRYK